MKRGEVREGILLISNIILEIIPLKNVTNIGKTPNIGRYRYIMDNIYELRISNSGKFRRKIWRKSSKVGSHLYKGPF